MASRRRTSPALGPMEDEDLLAEILLRLPPKPSSLPRASLVCRRWRSFATDAAFRRRFRTHHRRPPILGVFEECARKLKFMPLLDPPDRIPSDRFSLDLSAYAGDDQDHVHGDCHTSPFMVVMVGTDKRAQVAVARVYYRESGMWGDLISSAEPCAGYVGHRHCTLVGNALYWCLYGTADDGILKFDLDDQSLTVISKPPTGPIDSQIQIVRAEHGGLGLAILSYPSFQLWEYMVDCHGVDTWVPRKTVEMDEMLGRKADHTHIAGYAEDADAIFISMHKPSDSDPFRRVLVIVQLESMKVENDHGTCDQNTAYHPFTNFYTTGTARA